MKEPPARGLGLLRQRRFAALFFTQFLGAFNDNVYRNALVTMITFGVAGKVAEGSAELVTLCAGLFILPFFLLSATAGQLADRYDKAMLIRRVKVAEICIMILGAIAFISGSVTALIAILFLMGTQSAFFGPLKYGILPQQLAPDELVGGNALIQTATFVAILVGLTAGEALISVQGYGLVLTASAVVILACLGWWTSRAIPSAPPGDPGLKLDWNIWRQTWRSLRFATENRGVFTAILGISWFWFVGSTYVQLSPTYARDVLHGSSGVEPLLLNIFTLGIAIGSVLCARVCAGRILLTPVFIGATGMAIAGFLPYLLGAFTRSQPAPEKAYSVMQVVVQAANWPILMAFFGVAVCGGLFIVPLLVLVQQRSRPERRSRVIAANNICNALLMVLSAVLTIGLLRVGLHYDAIFAVVAALSVVVVIALSVVLPGAARE